jgi:hypothetical protein
MSFDDATTLYLIAAAMLWLLIFEGDSGGRGGPDAHV